MYTAPLNLAVHILGWNLNAAKILVA